MQFVKLVFVASACLVVRSAAAQPTPPVAAPESVLPNVLPTSIGATFDARVDYSRFKNGSELGDVMLFALNLHGQYIAPMGLGGYLSLPLALASDGDDGEAALGNPEIGGLYVHRGGNIAAYVRGGFALGLTNTEGGDDFLLAFANLAPRPADTLTAGVGSSWLRGGAGLRLRSGALVIGASGGVDLPLDSEAANRKGLLHLSGSIGVAQPGFGLAVGATMLNSLDDQGPGDSVFGLQAVADVPASARTRIYGAFGLFLEEAPDVFSVGVGLRVGI
jgi:hypothetical protein